MATIPVPTDLPVAETASGYWLFGRRADLGWFVLSLLVPLAIYLPPYWIWGKAAIWPLYVLYVAAFATPHTWLTYAVTLPASGRGHYSKASLWAPVLCTALIAACVPLTSRYGGWDLFFTLITMLGYYHVFKQHLGILRIYDAKYAETHRDPSIFAAMAPFHSLCTMAFALPVLYGWLFPPLEVVVDAQRFTLLHPQLASWVVWPYLAVMALYGWQVAKRLSARHRDGKVLPKAHLLVAGTIALSYLAAFGLVAPQDFLLSVAIFITFHDLQYGGFVWQFQRQRSQLEAAAGHSLDRLHRWALQNRYGAYFGLAIAFSVALLAVIMSLPTTMGLTVVVFHNTLHYLMDGWIWKRRHNAKLHQHLGMGAPSA